MATEYLAGIYREGSGPETRREGGATVAGEQLCLHRWFVTPRNTEPLITRTSYLAPDLSCSSSRSM